MEDGYGCGAFIIGALTFFGIWIYCSLTYGFLGFALGWMPALIIAFLCGVLWPLVILILLVVGALIWFGLSK